MTPPTTRRMGRPPKDPRGSTVPSNVWLVPEDWQTLREIGEGSPSEGIRRLLRERETRPE